MYHCVGIFVLNVVFTFMCTHICPIVASSGHDHYVCACLNWYVYSYSFVYVYLHVCTHIESVDLSLYQVDPTCVRVVVCGYICIDFCMCIYLYVHTYIRCGSIAVPSGRNARRRPRCGK